MKAKNFIKIAFSISLVLHVGVFALGGYVMDNITQELQKETITKSLSDITYVDIGITPEDTDKELITEPAKEAEVQSDVVVAEETLENKLPIEDKKEKEPSLEDVKKPSKHKFRTYEDTNIVVKEISKEGLVLEFSDVKDSNDLMPTYKHKEKPVYDYNLIPQGEPIIIVVEYVMDEQGKVIQAYPVLPAEKSDLGLSEEEYQDLNIACIQALEKYVIIPSKDKRGHIPQQEKFILTHEGAVKRYDF